MRRPPLTAKQIALLLTIVTFLGGIAANIAASSLPEPWRPYLWLAWPITGVFFLLTLALTVAAQREGPDLARQRALLLKRLKAEIKQALDNRLPERRQRIALALTHQPKVVMPRPGLRLEHPNQSPRPVPPGRPIIEVFDEAKHALLILGDPGAGKTTLLLELAEALVERAAQNPQDPLPIVLTLDTWTEHRGELEGWFAREASRVYGIGGDLARTWIDQDALIPLLDGFDEIARDAPGRRRLRLLAPGVARFPGQFVRRAASRVA